MKKGGTAILQVPLDESRTTTFEDNSITEPKERTRVFGQYDHVRVYGQDYYQRLEAAGFQVEANAFFSKIPPEEVKRFSLQHERIPVGIKKG